MNRSTFWQIFLLLMLLSGCDHGAIVDLEHANGLNFRKSSQPKLYNQLTWSVRSAKDAGPPLTALEIDGKELPLTSAGALDTQLLKAAGVKYDSTDYGESLYRRDVNDEVLHLRVRPDGKITSLYYLNPLNLSKVRIRFKLPGDVYFILPIKEERIETLFGDRLTKRRTRPIEF